MDETLLNTIEVIFNSFYLAIIWTIVFLMFRNKDNLKAANKKVGKLFLWAFFLLALGDTGHVGFRLIALASGGLEANPVLVGLGALATAITITFFYMIFVEIWRVRFNKERGIVWRSLMAIGIIRLLIMVPLENQWASVVPPFNWSLARNIPLMIIGIAVAVLMYINAKQTNDKMIIKICYMIVVSYVCYIPVILFIQEIPLIGMLMIPKTLAYLAIAFIAYRIFKGGRISIKVR